MRDHDFAPRRRDVLKAAAALAAAAFPLNWLRAADVPPVRKILFFTKSAGFEHDVIKRPSPEVLAYAEQILIELGKQHGYDVTATKDGGYFTPEKLAAFDAVVFYTTGDLTTPGKDGQPPMPADGEQTLIKWVESGKGFLGIHSADDTFLTQPGEPIHPYIKMIGAEFDKHGKQQNAKITAADKNFGPIKDLQDFELFEEWYKVKNLSPDLHVILVQETQSMAAPEYRERAPYPETWARTQGKGRIFYTSLGHREDVWKNPIFEQVVLGGLAWVTGNADADTTPNLSVATPGAMGSVRKD